MQEFTGPTTLKDFVALATYKVRVMLAHVRDQFDRGHAISDALLEIFAIMTTTQKKAGSIRSINRSHRLARENPFKHFRDSPSPSPSPVGGKEEPTVIIKYYNPKARQATMILSDGTQQFADECKRGERGFIQAAWFSPKIPWSSLCPTPSWLMVSLLTR